MTTPRRRLDNPGRRNRRTAAATAGVLLVVVLGAVLVTRTDDGPDSAATGTPGVGASSTAAPDGATASATPGATATPGGPSATVDPETDAIITPTEVERFQLRGSDLPPGWRTLDAARAATDALIGPCLREATTPTVPHVLTTTSFRSGSSGPVLTSTVRDFTTPADSARAMTSVRDAVLACARGTSKPALRTFALTSRADASVAVTFTVTQDGSSARGEVIVARVGARSVTVALVGLDAQDLEIGRDAVRTVVARSD